MQDFTEKSKSNTGSDDFLQGSDSEAKTQIKAEAPNAPVNEITEDKSSGIIMQSDTVERSRIRANIETERRIAKAQSEIAESVKRANINASSRRAEADYGNEYRKKLMEENERRLITERRLEEEKQNALLEEERRARAEKIQRAYESEQELFSKRNSETDELIKNIIKRRQERNAKLKNKDVLENIDFDAGEELFPLEAEKDKDDFPIDSFSDTDDLFPTNKISGEQESLVIEISEIPLVNKTYSSNVSTSARTPNAKAPTPPAPKAVPNQPKTQNSMPYGFVMPIAPNMRAGESEHKERLEEMTRVWNERNETLKSTAEGYREKLRRADELSRARHEEEMAKIKDAEDGLRSEWQRIHNEPLDFEPKAYTGTDYRRSTPSYYPDYKLGDGLSQREDFGTDVDFAERDYQGEQKLSEYESPYSDKTVSTAEDERVIAEYEKYLREKGVYNTEPEISPEPEIEISTSESNDNRNEAVSVSAISLTVKDTLANLKRTDKKIRKAQRREKGAQGSAAVLLYNNRLALEKEAVDMLGHTLCQCVNAKDKSKIRKFKKLLSMRIARYNLIVADFVVRTGTEAPLLSRSIPKDIIKGGAYKDTELLVYREVEIGHLSDIPVLSERELKRAEKDELRNAAIRDAEARKLERALVKNGFGANNLNLYEEAEISAILEEISEQRSRDEDMLEKRYEYLSLKGKTDSDLSKFTFGTRRKNGKDSLVRAQRLVNHAKKIKSKAQKYEKLDNDRYYEILALDTAKTVYRRKRADRAKLESVKQRMRSLLEKRDIINKRLYSIYAPVGEGGVKNIEEKYSNIRRREAKKAYKKQLKLYKSIEKQHLPLDIKEGIYKLMNEKITLSGKVSELAFRIKHANGYKKRELKRERRNTLRNLKALDADIEYYFKRKITKRINKNKTKKSQLIWLFAIVILLGGGYLVYRFFGSAIADFFRSLF